MPGGVAARSMAWHRRMGSVAGPLSASGEQSNGQPLQVELLISGAWTDITSYVMTRDGSGHIEITRGARDEGSVAEQSTCTFQLNNRDGRFSPRNPNSPYYGALGRNQQVRVSVPGPALQKLYRFWGEVSAWPQRWDITGRDIWVEVEAAGPLRRLNQGAAPTKSVVYGGVMDPQLDSLLAYWPCEDAEGAEVISSPLITCPAMQIDGLPELASYSGFGGSDPLPVMTGGSFSGGVARYDTTTTTTVQMRALLYVPSEGLNDEHTLLRLTMDSDAIKYWDVVWNGPDNSYLAPSGSLSVTPRDGDDAYLAVAGTQYMDNSVKGRHIRVSLTLSSSGGSTAFTLATIDAQSGASFSVSGTAANPLTRVLAVTAFPETLYNTLGGDACSVGHVTLQGVSSPISDLGSRLDPTGEAAGQRIKRLCTEEGLFFDSVGDLDDTVLMGGQGRIKPVELMREAELADGGMLFENLKAFGLGYRTRASMMNQAAALNLSYPANELSEVPEPVDDDQRVKNRVAVSRENGTVTETAELTTGGMSTLDPPVGIGVYGEELTLNLKDDSVLLDQAQWRLAQGTVDEARFPQISVNLARPQIANNQTLREQLLSVREGDRLVLADPPAWLPPDDITQLVLGIKETIDHFQHHMTFMCAPESPWRAGVLEDPVVSRMDTGGSVIYDTEDASATEIYVTPTDGVTWTTDSADFPFDVRAGGEIMTVTSIANTVTDDFTRVTANGWGTATSGSVWSSTTGAASERNTNGTQGVITWAATPTLVRINTCVTGARDVGAIVTVSVSQVATGASLCPGIVMRYESSSAYYRARVHFGTSGTMFITILRETTIIGPTVSLPYTYAANDKFRLRAKIVGHTISAKAWPIAEVEPLAWQVSQTIPNGKIASGAVGLVGSALTGNTNVAPQLLYDDFSLYDPQLFTVVRSVNGVSKTQTEGTDIRLAEPTIISL